MAWAAQKPSEIFHDNLPNYSGYPLSEETQSVHDALEHRFVVEEPASSKDFRHVAHGTNVRTSRTPLPGYPLFPSRPTPTALRTFHPKTGRIRQPRDSPSPTSSASSSPSGSDSEDMPTPQPVSFPKIGREEYDKSVDERGWVSTARTPYGANKPKCPPCHRLKKKDPCRGPPPCRECYAKGRRTAKECQEWGEGFVRKIRRGGQPRS